MVEDVELVFEDATSQLLVGLLAFGRWFAELGPDLGELGALPEDGQSVVC